LESQNIGNKWKELLRCILGDIFLVIYFRFTSYSIFFNYKILYSFYRKYFPKANLAEAQILSTSSCHTEFRELANTPFWNLRRYVDRSPANRQIGFHVCTFDVRYSLVHTFVHYRKRYSPIRTCATSMSLCLAVSSACLLEKKIAEDSKF
jgi:hypothetical protein